MGQLGHSATLEHCFVPTKISSIIGVKQISYGSCSEHFLAQDSENKIFVMGRNDYGQLAVENKEVKIPEEMDPGYFTIWGSVPVTKAKSARK